MNNANDLQYIEENDALECIFTGKLTADYCISVESILNEKVKNATEGVTFNLEKVDYVASAFLRLCMMAFKAAGQDKFKIINVSPEVKKIFTMVGFGSMIE